MNKEKFISEYWNYYLNLENSVINIENYITFDEKNSKCFSIEFIKIFQTICSEIDVMLELITSKNNMMKYKVFLLENVKYNKIKDSKTNLILNKKWLFHPFYSLNTQSSIQWWRDYNNVKHHRQTNNNYTKANLGNILQSLSALYVIELFFYNINFYNDNCNESIPIQKSKLFDSINNIEDNVVEQIHAIIMAE